MSDCRVEIFISYCWANESVAKTIYDHLHKKVNLHLDKLDIGGWKSIKEYMQSIPQMDYTVLLISDAYLKSVNCMYEVLEVLRDRNYKDKIFPVVIDKSIYNPKARAEYVKYWQNQYADLKESLQGVDIQNIGRLGDDLKQRQDISSNVANFLDMVSDMNNPAVDDVCFIIEQKLSKNGLIQNSQPDLNIPLAETDSFSTMGIPKPQKKITELETNQFLVRNFNVLRKKAKIFISHSTRDIEFVRPLIDLFEHIGLTAENMFCSSVPGYSIPLGENIYDYLKEQFQNYDLRVVFILSENYYNSPASLNEMGAAWVLQYKYTSVLIPQFDFRDIKGVIDQMRISIKLDSDIAELKSRLNELRNTLVEEFGLKTSLSLQNIWERHRDEFIGKVNSTEIYWKNLRRLKERGAPLKEWISPLQKLIETNPFSYDAMYMLGTIYAQINDFENAVKLLKMTANLSQSDELRNKANERLQKLGYII